MLSCQAPVLSCPYLSFVVAIQAPACVQLFVTPWTAACQASPSLTVSQSMPMFMSIASATPSSHLISSHLNLSFNHHLSVYLVPVSPDNKLHRVCSPPSHPKANTSICDTTNAQQTLQSAWLQSQTLCSQRGLCFSVPVAGTPRPSCTPAPWGFPGKSTGVGCHFLLQEIFLTQRSNSCLLHCRQVLHHSDTRESLPVGWPILFASVYSVRPLLGSQPCHGEGACVTQ